MGQCGKVWTETGTHWDGAPKSPSLTPRLSTREAAARQPSRPPALPGQLLGHILPGHRPGCLEGLPWGHIEHVEHTARRPGELLIPAWAECAVSRSGRWAQRSAAPWTYPQGLGPVSWLCQAPSSLAPSFLC